MDLRQLKHFLAVVDARSMQQAAEMAHVSQQGLSKSIRALEKSLGVQLLDRGPFGARPTKFGEHLVQRARLICGHSRLAEEDMRSLKLGEVGTVSIGVGPYFESHVMPDVLVNFSRRCPNVSVRLVPGNTDSLVDRVVCGEIDFSVTTPHDRYVFPEEAEAHVLFSEREAAIVRPKHPAARRENCRLADLTKYPWILSATATSERERVNALLKKHGKRWPPRVVLADSVTMITSLLSRDDYVHISAPSLLLRLASTTLTSIDVVELRDRRAGVLTRRRNDTMFPASRVAMELVLATWKQRTAKAQVAR